MIKSYFFFFNHTAPPEIYTLSLHDALPIYRLSSKCLTWSNRSEVSRAFLTATRDRKSTRLNSSHQIISYAVFCLKKKKTQTAEPHTHIHSAAADQIHQLFGNSGMLPAEEYH